jgi:hypothetical protein
MKNDIRELCWILIIKMTRRVSFPANLPRPSLLSDGYHMLTCEKSGEWRDELPFYLVMWSRTSSPLQTLSGAAFQARCRGKTIMCSFTLRLGTLHLGGCTASSIDIPTELQTYRTIITILLNPRGWTPENLIHSNISTDITIVFSLLSLFWKKLKQVYKITMLSVLVYPLSGNVWMPEKFFIKLGMYIMASEPISTVCFINSSYQSVYPQSLLGNGSVKTLPRQQIHMVQYMTCWTRRFMCGSCRIKGK